MSISPITQSELNRLKVAALPARPNASGAFGGLGYSSAELRAAFDRLPELLVSRYNALVEAISAAGEASLCGAIPTGIHAADGREYTLADLLAHICDGTFATYLRVGGSYLDLVLAALAPLTSPALTGTPTAPMPPVSDNSGRIATTAWVRELMGEFSRLYDDVRAGTYGNVPTGGGTGSVLAKSEDKDHALCWLDPTEHLFSALHVETPTSDTDPTRAANIDYVEQAVAAAVAALKGGVSSAYDTLQELAAAIASNDGEIADALEEIASKEVKTVYATLPASGVLTLQNNTEYTATSSLDSLRLTLLSSPAQGFMAGLEFSTSGAENITFSYTGGTLYATGADCDNGMFCPVSAMHYSAVIWYAGGKYQMAVRRSQ